MGITIDDLRKEWLEQMQAYEQAIALLEKEKAAGVLNEGLGKPTRLWMDMLGGWRDELKQLLEMFPGSK